MGIPDYQSIMLPLLRYASDGKEHSLRETIEVLAEQFSLSEDERKQLLPSGRQATFDNRVGWARTYMKKAGLLESTRRGYFQITQRGLDIMRNPPGTIDNDFLEQFEEFREFQALKKDTTNESEIPESSITHTPEESLESSFQQVKQSLTSDILQTIKRCTPAFFEKLVVDVLVKMGYGGTRKDAGRAIGKSGDDGIDGIIKEDRLGLDIIYIQAKRWDNVVGRPEVQKFAGALQGHRAKKGIFITTSSFTKDAEEYVSRIDNKIVLIDGQTLAQLMIDHNVGVTLLTSYEIKKIDLDYFTEG